MKEMVTVPRGEKLILRGDAVIAGRNDAPIVELYNVAPGQRIRMEAENATAYGFAAEAGKICSPSGMHWIGAGMHYCSPGPVWTEAAGLLVVIHDWRGLFSIGGPIEAKGRLKYIDGCSDTLIVGPPKCGDPCLNHLHFPPGIRQTMHTHPSLRCGIVADGQGRAVLGCGDELPLNKGDVWILPCGGAHCFFTDDRPMQIIAFHPDSDTGPRDEDHPMLNRTYVDGESARNLPKIQTAEI